MRLISDVRGITGADEIREGVRFGLLLAIGLAPETALRACEELRVQRFETTGDGDFEIDFVHEDLWDPSRIDIDDVSDLLKSIIVSGG